MYYYRHHEDSAMHRPLTKKRLDDELAVAQTQWTLFKDRFMSKKVRSGFEQRISKRLYEYGVKKPQKENTAQAHEWFLLYVQHLIDLESQQIFKPQYLSFKNRIKYRCYKHRYFKAIKREH
jgi:hypothetical protein